jgi:hypothetical protein
MKRSIGKVLAKSSLYCSCTEPDSLLKYGTFIQEMIFSQSLDFKIAGQAHEPP